jgi:phosphonate transport system substrate-binding protein
MMTQSTIAFILTACLVAVSAVQAETIRFAPLPMQNQETVIKEFRSLTTYLEQCLQVTIEYVYSNSYSDILEKFRRSEVDLAYLGPLPYVELRSHCAEAEPLVQFKESSGQATYTCAMVSFPDSGFHPAAAEKRKIALTQPLSTCGYLSTSGLMRHSGGSLERNYYRYLGQHDAVALSVLRGEFDAGGLKTAIARKYAHLGLQVISETAPLPGFALIGNTKTMPIDLMSRLRQELTALDPAGRDKAMLSTWSDNLRHGTVAASDRDFQAVRELLTGAVIPSKGNF